MPKVNLSFFLCFSREAPETGNPAAVIEHFVGSDEEKQELATQLNLPVTIFIEDENAEIPRLRFFYPASEMQLCLHGALAGAELLMQARAVDQLAIQTVAGRVLQVSRQAGDLIQVALERGHKLEMDISHTDVESMLGISLEEIDTRLPFCVASIGSPKLLIPLKSREVLDALQPDFDLIKAWSVKHNVNGLYVYTQDVHEGVDFAARGFNPRGGMNEDPATGVSAGAVVSVLPASKQQDFVFDQGDAMGMQSRLYISVQKEKLLVGGRVILQTQAH